MPLLEVHGASKRFGGVDALSRVTMTVNAGEVVGLIGPNGAGKTTLFDCIGGFRSVDHGRILFGGQDVTGWPAHDRARLGLARTFQIVQTFASMTVSDNLALAAHAHTGSGVVADAMRLRSSRRAQRAAREAARAVAAFLGIEHLLGETVGELPFGMQRQVELARALCARPRLLMLDEAASGLDATETAGFAESVWRARSATGTAVLWIEHDVPLIRDVSDYVYVLDFGELLAEDTPDEVTDDPRVREAYMGAGEPTQRRTARARRKA